MDRKVQGQRRRSAQTVISCFSAPLAAGFWVNAVNYLINKCKDIMLSLRWQFLLSLVLTASPKVLSSVDFWCTQWLFLSHPIPSEQHPVCVGGSSDLQIKHYSGYKKSEKLAVLTKVQSPCSWKTQSPLVALVWTDRFQNVAVWLIASSWKFQFVFVRTWLHIWVKSAPALFFPVWFLQKPSLAHRFHWDTFAEWIMGKYTRPGKPSWTHDGSRLSLCCLNPPPCL